MKIKIGCLDIYKNIKAAEILTKTAENVLDYAPDKASLDESIYQDTADLGASDFDSEELRQYLEYANQAEPQAQEYQAPAAEDQGMVSDYVDDYSYLGMTPDEYLSFLNNYYYRQPYELGMGAQHLYDNVGNQKLGSEQVDKTINEIIKVGKLQQQIDKKLENGEKVAAELNLINKDYLTTLLGSLL